MSNENKFARVAVEVKAASQPVPVSPFGNSLNARLSLPPPVQIKSLKFIVADILDAKGCETDEDASAAGLTPLSEIGATRTEKPRSGNFQGGSRCDTAVAVARRMPDFYGGSHVDTAIAVASEKAHFGIGIDTVGGVRTTAAFFGIFGFRPSHGAISMVGLVQNSAPLDTIGLYWTGGHRHLPMASGKMQGHHRCLHCAIVMARLGLKKSLGKFLLAHKYSSQIRP